MIDEVRMNQPLRQIGLPSGTQAHEDVLNVLPDRARPRGRAFGNAP